MKGKVVKLKVLPSTKAAPRPPLSEATLCETMDRMAANGWKIDLQHSHFTKWRCTISWPYDKKKLTAEQEKDFHLLMADSGYYCSGSFEAFAKALKIHAENAPKWVEKYGKANRACPVLRAVG